MFNSIYESSNDTAAACLHLVRKYGPKLMRAGGGTLSRENKHPRRTLSWNQKQRVLKLAREGKTQPEITEITGISQPSVWKIVRNAGLKTVQRKRTRQEIIMARAA